MDGKGVQYTPLMIWVHTFDCITTCYSKCKNETKIQTADLLQNTKYFQ